MRKPFSFGLLLCCMAIVASLNAQPQTVQATVSAGASSEHLYVAVGQPFFQQLAIGDNFELSMGVAQAQWTRDTVYDVITYNTPYTENYFSLPAQRESRKDSVYVVNGGIYNYDLLRTLYLIVCPEKLTDYDVLAVSGHCWTKQNLRTSVEGAMAYSSEQSPTVPQKYGLLYTWQAAMNGTSADEDGYVQGICPAQNWHLPDATEISDLRTNSTESLRSVDDWAIPNGNNNSTGFTAYPAGFYNSVTQRFEGLGTQTDWWMVNGIAVNGTATAAEAGHATSLQIPYYCDTPIIVLRNPNDAVSVRCVMKNVWPE